MFTCFIFLYLVYLFLCFPLCLFACCFANTLSACTYCLPCRNHVEVIKVLLSVGADGSGKTFGGTTPLHTASMLGHSDATQILCDSGVAIEAQVIIVLQVLELDSRFRESFSIYSQEERLWCSPQDHDSPPIKPGET